MISFDDTLYSELATPSLTSLNRQPENHCDIMGGTFVPNFTMGVMDVQTIRRYTDKPVDCHLMIENPSNKVDWFIKAGANIIYIHPESE